MAKIILNDGTEEYLSPGDAQAKVSAGEAVWAQGVPMYSTRQMVAAPTRQIVAEPVKPRRKRKPKKDEVLETEEEKVETNQVDTDEVE